MPAEERVAGFVPGVPQFRVAHGFKPGRASGDPQSPEVALRFAGATHERGMLPRIGEGLALTASTGGKPRLTLAGKDSVA